jgi:hypothetical protein
MIERVRAWVGKTTFCRLLLTKRQQNGIGPL